MSVRRIRRRTGVLINDPRCQGWHTAGCHSHVRVCDVQCFVCDVFVARKKPSGPLVYDSFVGEQTSNNYGLRYLNHLKTI